MSECNNNYFVIPFYYNDVVWETPENKPFGSLCPGLSGHRREGEESTFYKVNCSVNGIGKFNPEALSFTFVPSRSRFSFFCSLMENFYKAHYRASSLARILLRNSSRSRNFAWPVSTSAIRREISLSQASSTPVSRGASRLCIRSWASSARSDSESAKSSERSRSRGLLAIRPPETSSIDILAPAVAPNKSIQMDGSMLTRPLRAQRPRQHASATDLGRWAE
jgi:hypothetical protein